jgi:O-acetylhomoserine (thiol)-lyase
MLRTSVAALTIPMRSTYERKTVTISSDPTALDSAGTDLDPTQAWSFETKQIHAGHTPDPTSGARALPIYQTTSYAFESTEHARGLFSLEDTGNVYGRIMNPTQDAIEQRIAALEGGVAALLLSSGQAAVASSILNLATSGDHIVTSPRLYGGSYTLFRHTLARYGITVSFVQDPDDLDQWRAAVRPNTKAFFGESISNPRNDVFDIEGVASVAHEHGLPLVIDNTVATPYLIQPLRHGADIVVHSATKYLGGHGTTIAGVLVDGAPSTGPRAGSPTSPPRTRVTTVWSMPSWGRPPTRSRPESRCCATSAPPSRRSAPSCWAKASRP